MCSNIKCRKRYDCYRYMAEPNSWQSYLVIEDPDNCKHFWKVDRSVRTRSMEEITKLELTMESINESTEKDL